MTGNNAKNMTIEEILVQHIKNVGLGVLVQDEDNLTELVTRAIKEAIYQPIRVPKQYGGWEEKDSLLIDTARPVARALLEKTMKAELEKILAEPENLKVIRDAMMLALPTILMASMRAGYSEMMQNASGEAMNMLRNLPR